MPDFLPTPPPLAQPALAQPAPGPVPAPVLLSSPDSVSADAIPLAALAYSLPTTAVGRRRPGLLSALGVMSIVGGCFGVVFSGAGVVAAVIVHLATRAADATAAHAPPSALPAFLAPVNAKPARIPTGQEGLPEAHRRLALGAIQSIHPLPPPRLEQLDAVLARAGKKILGVHDLAGFSSDAVREAVTDHGQLYAASRKVVPPDYFQTQSGRLELYDERAVFYPVDGSTPVRSTTASASAPKPLTAEQVQAVVQQVRAAPDGNRLNAAQVSGVSMALGFPNQRLAQASAGLGDEPRAVTIHPGGGATVRFSGGELYLGAQGQILGAPSSDTKALPVAANVPALVSVVAALGLGVALAIVLVVAGVRILRDSPGRSRAGRRLHLIWATIKIPLAFLTAAAVYWMATSFIDAVVGSAGAAGGRAFGTGSREVRLARTLCWWAVGAAASGCVYPLAALLVLRAKRIRQFYDPVD